MLAAIAAEVTVEQAVGSLGQAVGSLGQAVGSLGQAVGSLEQAVGSLGHAVGSLEQAVGSLGQAVGSLGQAAVLPTGAELAECCAWHCIPIHHPRVRPTSLARTRWASKTISSLLTRVVVVLCFIVHR